MDGADHDRLSGIWCDEDGEDWEVNFWETSGKSPFQLRYSAYPGTCVLLIGFDMTKGLSLENVPFWYEEAHEIEPNIGAIIVVGTKSDLYEELRDSGKGSDGQPLKTIDQMYAIAQEVGAHAVICTSAKTGYGTLADAEEGPAVDADPDTLSGQGEQYLGATSYETSLILKFVPKIMNGEEIPKLVTSPPCNTTLCNTVCPL